MKLNYMQCWNGAMTILRDHKEAILAIAGVFLFLPTLLMAQYVGQPDFDGTEDLNAMAAAYSSFASENIFSIALSNLLMSFGGFVIYVIISSTTAQTVGDNIGTAAKLFLFFILANLLTGLATAAGLLLLIIPGLYIAARFSVVPMVVADRGERNPIEALRQSWAITKDNGFSILLLIIIIALVGSIFLAAIQMILGVGIGLATGGEGWPLITNIVAALINTALGVLLIVIAASIYRLLSAEEGDVGEVFT